MENVFIMDHPLIQHKISYIRREDVGTKEFREVIPLDSIQYSWSND